MNSFEKSEKKASLAELLPIIAEKLSSGGSVTFKPHGVSMLPLIRQGKDSVTVEVAPQKSVKNDVIFYRRSDGQFVLHRIVGEDEKGYILCGDNQRILEYGVKPQWIIGIMTAVIRNNKTILCSSKKYKLYLRLVLPLWRLWVKLRGIAGKIVRKIKKV